MKKKLGKDQTRPLRTNLIGCLLQCLKKKDAFVSHRPETILDNSFCLMKPSRASSPMTADAASLTTFIPHSTAWVWQGYQSSSRRVRMKPLISSSDNFIVSGGSKNLAVFQSKSTALHNYKLKWEEAGQRPQRGRSPVEHRGTFVRPEMANGLRKQIQAWELSWCLRSLRG